MHSDFAIFLVSLQDRSSPGEFEFDGLIIGREPAFQINDRGPWTLYDARSGIPYTLEYLIPPYVELSTSSESPTETIMKHLQSAASFPFRVQSHLHRLEVPTMLGFQFKAANSVQKSRFRCVCCFPNLKASFSPDIKAMLHDTAILERATSGIVQRIPMPKNSRIQSLVERYATIAADTDVKEGTRLPCQIESELGPCYAVCLLAKDLGKSTFLCDIYFERPVNIRPGDKLIRTVLYDGLGVTIEFTSGIANVERVV